MCVSAIMLSFVHGKRPQITAKRFPRLVLTCASGQARVRVLCPWIIVHRACVVLKQLHPGIRARVPLKRRRFDVAMHMCARCVHTTCVRCWRVACTCRHASLLCALQKRGSRLLSCARACTLRCVRCLCNVCSAMHIVCIVPCRCDAMRHVAGVRARANST